jgi:hypothetical protein
MKAEEDPQILRIKRIQKEDFYRKGAKVAKSQRKGQKQKMIHRF